MHACDTLIILYKNLMRRFRHFAAGIPPVGLASIETTLTRRVVSKRYHFSSNVSKLHADYNCGREIHIYSRRAKYLSGTIRLLVKKWLKNDCEECMKSTTQSNTVWNLATKVFTTYPNITKTPIKLLKTLLVIDYIYIHLTHFV